MRYGSSATDVSVVTFSLQRGEKVFLCPETL